MTGVATVDRPSATLAPVVEPPTSALRVDELVAATGGRLVRRSDRPILGARVDSRLVEPGNLFVALPGEHTDGHLFLGPACAAGAAALLVTAPVSESALEALGDVSIIAVPDAVAALGAIAARWRGRFDPLVVGVTGSIAKTSAKEAAAAVLARRFRTLRSPGNRNNEIGLPLTLLDLGPEHEAVVLEMGMYVGGEIADLARIARPRIGLVTAIEGVHVSRIGSIEAVEQAKGELVEALPSDGVAILNADDPRVLGLAARTRARVVTYGLGGSADVTAETVESAGLAGMRFDLVARVGPGGPARSAVAIPGLGRLSVHNALAGAAVGLAAGLRVDEIAAGLAAGWSAPRRATIHRLGGLTIVDDSYNAAPASMLAAFDLLGGLPGRRVAILGEMLELGEDSEAGHRTVGRAAAVLVDLLVLVGPGTAPMAEAALATGLPADRLVRVADRAAALEAYLARRRDGDTVLVKASRGVELDRLVDALVEALGSGAARS